LKTALILEDEWNDIHLIHRVLRGVVLTCFVTDRKDYVHALIENKFDIIITDLNVHTFLDFETVTLARTKQPETPLIVLTGSISELDAKKSLLHGATFYIMKNGFRELKDKVKTILNV